MYKQGIMKIYELSSDKYNKINFIKIDDNLIESSE